MEDMIVTELQIDPKTGYYSYGGLEFVDSVKVDNLYLKLLNYTENHVYHKGIGRSYIFEILNGGDKTSLRRIKYQRNSSDHKTLFYNELRKSHIGDTFKISGIVDNNPPKYPNDFPNIWRVIKYEKV